LSIWLLVAVVVVVDLLVAVGVPGVIELQLGFLFLQAQDIR
jgi:hypothetical protein